MSAANKMRGATALRSEKRLTRKHLLAVCAITVAVALSTLLLPSNDVEANRNVERVTDAVDNSATLPLPAASTTLLQIQSETPAPEPAATEIWNEIAVVSGDNLSLIFKRAGFSDRDIYRITKKTNQGKSLTRIFPGQTIAFKADENDELMAVRHKVSALESVTYHKSNKGFKGQRDMRTPQIQQSSASAVITSSLYLAGQKAGLSQNMIMEMANIFGGVIDFALDPRVGDTINLIYEDLYLDGEKFKDGAILAASFTNRGKTFNAFRYTDSTGKSNYYNENGVSMQKAFLLSPVDFTRISSNFNMRRLHPIYKTTRPHRGTDYAAARGTPVFATGEGRVIKAGYNKSNGNYVFIQHGEQYVTKYLHLHKRKVGKGQRVVQSQVIGTVGSTGAATGPHLHYEFLLNGVHRNPRTIHKKLPKAETLAATEMPAFKKAITNATTQLASLQNSNNLAMNDLSSSAP
ncbi:MAG: murein DD-endopeptidase MepM/ murein hydrolase activator NlpD [Halioglobus sp.]|jgi:murein DD-endopeptidase MepM/ murein hydrolase activator NlpD